jgi:hypothetical protein
MAYCDCCEQNDVDEVEYAYCECEICSDCINTCYHCSQTWCDKCWEDAYGGERQGEPHCENCLNGLMWGGQDASRN